MPWAGRAGCRMELHTPFLDRPCDAVESPRGQEKAPREGGAGGVGECGQELHVGTGFFSLFNGTLHRTAAKIGRQDGGQLPVHGCGLIREHFVRINVLA